MNVRLQKTIDKNSISLEEFSKSFTPEEKKQIEAEIKYLEVLIELKKNRKRLGLTQSQLATKADLPRTTITKIESGSYNPTLSTLMNIASAMNKKLQVKLV